MIFFHMLWIILNTFETILDTSLLLRVFEGTINLETISK